MTKTLTFTVEGAYITQTARTLLADGKYQSAFELVKNATITDDLSPIEHDHLIFDILRKLLPYYSFLNDIRTKSCNSI